MWQKVAKFKGAEYFRKALYIYLSKNIWGIGNDADNYIDGSYNLYAILKLIYPLKNTKIKRTLQLFP